MTLPSATLVTLGLLFLIVIFVSRKIWRLKKTFGAFPQYPFILDFAYKTVTGQIPKHLPTSHFFLESLLRILSKFREEGVCVLWLFKPIVIVYGEDYVKAINNDPSTTDKPQEYNIVKDYLGFGILTSNGDRWKEKRKLFNPMFHLRMLKDMTTVFNNNSTLLIKDLELISRHNTPVDVLKIIKPFAFYNICDAVLGRRFCNPDGEMNIDDVLRKVDILSEMLTYRLVRPWLYNISIMYLWPPFWKNLRHLKNVKKWLKNIILDMKWEVLSEKSKETNILDVDVSSSRKFLIDALLEHHLTDPTFTLEDVEDEIYTFLTAGYDTVASSIMWCLFMLGLQPEIQDQAYAEISILQNDSITYDDVTQLEYLECVIKESMRLYPPVPLYARNTGREFTCGKYIIPKNTVVVLSPYMLHKNPSIYPNPERFDPERFRETNLGKRPWIFTPFAEGLRYCIGKNFAMLQMKTVLIHILRKFKVTSLTQREDIVMCWSLVSYPAEPVRIQFERRNR